MSESIPFYLFVCFGNEDRSPTAATICRKMARQRGLNIKVDSAGLSSEAWTRVTEQLAREADKIFVMEKYMIKRINERCDRDYSKKMICLDIEDEYSRGCKVLVDTLEKKLDKFL